MDGFLDDNGERIVAGQPYKKDDKWRCKCGGLCSQEMPGQKLKAALLLLLRDNWKRNYASWWCPTCFANPPERKR